MDLDLGGNGDIRKLVDELLLKGKELYLPEAGITVTTLHGAFAGVLMERTKDFVVLRADIRRKVMDGALKGKCVFQYHYIQLQSVIGVTFELAE